MDRLLIAILLIGFVAHDLLVNTAEAGEVISHEVSEKFTAGLADKDTDNNIEDVSIYCRGDRSYLCDPRKSRFSDYQPNYIIYQDTEGDDRSLEGHYSFKYLFTRPHCMPLSMLEKRKDLEPEIDCLKNYDTRWELFFTYTGEFDFYLGTRDSGPVINRINNPALHYRKYFGDTLSFDNFTLRWVNVGLEHRSNGQVVEADELITDENSPDDGRYRAQVEYENGNYEYFDAISRGANYLSIESKFNIGADHSDKENCKSCITAWLSAKLYLTEDSSVYWGEYANRDVKISDFDRVKLILADRFNTSYKHIPKIEFGVEWTVGDKFLSTDSLDINLFFPWILNNNLTIPLYVRAHIGPMNTLSDYTREQNSIGIGLRFQ